MDNLLLGRPVGPQKRFVEKYVGQVMMGIPGIWFILWAALVLVVGIFPTVTLSTHPEPGAILVDKNWR
jgi:hypothetical protein